MYVLLSYEATQRKAEGFALDTLWYIVQKDIQNISLDLVK